MFTEAAEDYRQLVADYPDKARIELLFGGCLYAGR